MIKYFLLFCMILFLQIPLTIAQSNATKEKNKYNLLDPQPLAPEQINYSRIPLEKLEVTLEADKSLYQFQELIKYRIILTNRSEQEIPLIFYYCNDPLQVTIYNDKGKLIWFRRPFLQKEQCRFYFQKMGPMESISKQYTWNQSRIVKKGPINKRIPGVKSGKYRIEGKLQLFKDVYHITDQWDSLVNPTMIITIKKDGNQ